MVAAALEVWRPEDWGGLRSRKHLTWAMEDEWRLMWNIVEMSICGGSKRSTELRAMGVLWEGKGFLTRGGNGAGGPDGVACTEPGMLSTGFMLWRTFNQMCHIVDDSNY